MLTRLLALVRRVMCFEHFLMVWICFQMIPTTVVCELASRTSWRLTERKFYLRWLSAWHWRRLQCPASATAWLTPTLVHSRHTWRLSLTLPCRHRLCGTLVHTRAESVRTIVSPEKRSSCSNFIRTRTSGCAPSWSSSRASVYKD